MAQHYTVQIYTACQTHFYILWVFALQKWVEWKDTPITCTSLGWAETLYPAHKKKRQTLGCSPLNMPFIWLWWFCLLPCLQRSEQLEHWAQQFCTPRDTWCMWWAVICLDSGLSLPWMEQDHSDARSTTTMTPVCLEWALAAMLPDSGPEYHIYNKCGTQIAADCHVKFIAIIPSYIQNSQSRTLLLSYTHIALGATVVT